MKIPRILILLGLSFVMTLSSCEKDEEAPIDNLEKEGLLGRWQLQSSERNGIFDLSKPCCQEVEFKADSNPADLKGEFKSTFSGIETSGAFALNSAKDTLTLNFSSSQRTYGFDKLNETFTLIYTEQNDTIVEEWKKEE